MAYAIEDIRSDPAIRACLLPLNNESARETSPLDAAKLARMIEAVRVATVAGAGAAFLLAFDQTADYDSPNFIWFRERYDSFLYVDRVIVGEAHRRLGLGRLLYEDLFHRAERLGFRRIACEVNIRPPNPASDAFHARLGFAEVGQATTLGGDKTVRYMLRALGAAL
jgi:predicted GNAT superfamily acetyltransferase